MSPSRRSVTTVLFTDIVGSTETAERLGDRRWRNVLAQHHAFVRNELRRYHGEEIATAGDGFLAVFEIPALALLCAASIRDAVRELGLEIRSGVHHGEIQRDSDGSVGGIAVHIGSRVASLAEADEILVSGTVRDAVQGAGFEFEDRGEKQLKGMSGAWHLHALTTIPEGLEEELLAPELSNGKRSTLVLSGLGVLAVATVLAFVFIRPSDDGREEVSDSSPNNPPEVASSPIDRSIAVLPFDLRSSNEDDAFFARGMHDDLLTKLAQIDSLKVISRTSVERYAGTTTPVRQIGEDLGVATVLEGAVQRSGDRIRLNVQLIDARKDEHLWAASYDEDLTADNLFKIQTDLASRIAGALRARLPSRDEAWTGAKPTQSLEAYLHRARGGRIIENSTSLSDREMAAHEFKEAIRSDSTYALAWVDLAWYEYGNWILGYRSADEAFPAVRSAADRALALEPQLAAAYAISGRLYMSQWRFDEADTEFLKAIELAPGLASTHFEYSELLFYLERFQEAEREVLRAIELDPQNGLLVQQLAWSQWVKKDWEGTIQEAERALSIDPNDGNAYMLLSSAYGWNGDHAAALKALETGRQRDPSNPYWTVVTANALARAGNRAEALRWLDRMPPSSSGYMLVWVAIVYGTLGDADRAFEILGRLALEDPYQLVFLGFDRDFDPIRDDPRFEEVRRRAREEVLRRNLTY